MKACLFALWALGASAQTGPVAWWQFNGNYNDSIANLSTASQPGPSISLQQGGPYRSSVFVNSSYLTLQLPRLPMSLPWSMTFWSRVEAYKDIDQTSTYPFAMETNASENAHFYVAPNIDYSNFCNVYGGIQSTNQLGCQPSNGAWYHWGFVGSYAAGLQNIAVYFNGVPTGFTAQINVSAPSDAWNGFEVTGAVPTQLSDLRFYDHNLTDNEVFGIYSMAPAQAPLPPSPSPSPPPPHSPPPSPPWPPLPPAGTLPLANTSYASLTIGPQTTGRIPAGFSGISFGKEILTYNLLTPQNAPLIQLFRNLGAGTVRIGAATVNTWSWAPNGTGSQHGVTAPSDVDNLGGFLKATGWKVLYGLNGVSPIPNPLPSTYTPPDTANTVLEAVYVYNALGDSVSSFEIGNEPDLYASQGLKYANYSATDVVLDFNAYRDAIVGAGIAASFSGPSLGWMTVWAGTFASAVQQNITQLTIHSYLNSNRGTVNLATLTNPTAVNNPSIPDIAKLNGFSLGLRDGFRISEANTFYSGNRAGIANTFASALWLIRFSFDIAQTNASGINFMSAEGRFGYSPLPIDPKLPLGFEPAPEYYGMLFFASVGPGSSVNTSWAGALPPNLLAYATFNGTYTVALLNTAANDTASVAMSFPGGFYTTSAILLTAQNLSSTTGVTFGGGPLQSDGSWHINTTYEVLGNTVNVPPASALLIRTAGPTPPSPPSPPSPPPPHPPSPPQPHPQPPTSNNEVTGTSIILCFVGITAALLAHRKTRFTARAISSKH